MQKDLSKAQHLTFLGVLTAIIVIMAFTPLGYLRTGGLEITFIIIPVAIGAVILKPIDGAILGGIFGLTSFVQCFGLSPFGATLLQINWLLTFVVCFVPRVLAGFLGALIFSLLKKNDKTQFISYATACLAVPVLNTVFFMATLVLCFYNTPFIQTLVSQLGATSMLAFVSAFVGLQGVIEAVVCFILGTAISKALAVAMKKMAVKA